MGISFFNLQTQEFAGLNGKKKFELDITNFYNSVEFDMPYFLFVVFQTGKANTQEKDSSQFDHCKLQNIYLNNGTNEIFPQGSCNLNPPSQYLKVYDAFTEFKSYTNKYRIIHSSSYSYQHLYYICIKYFPKKKYRFTFKDSYEIMCRFQ
jgi:hypothetical protein